MKSAVYVYTPLCRAGHIDSYTGYIVEGFCRLGFNTVLACPTSFKVNSRLNELKAKKLLYIVRHDRLSRGRSRWTDKDYGEYFRYRTPWEIMPLAPCKSQFWRTLWKWIISKTIYRLSVHLSVRHKGFLELLDRDAQVAPPPSTDARFVAYAFNMAFKKFRFRPELFLDTYIDHCQSYVDCWGQGFEVGDVYKAALLFSPGEIHQELLARDSSCQLLCVFSGSHVKKLCGSDETLGNRVLVLPDVTSTERLCLKHASVKGLKKWVGSRKLVLLAGSINKVKDLALFLKLVRYSHACGDNVLCYAIVGRVNYSDLPACEAEELKRLNSVVPSKLLLLDSYIDSQSEFDSLISLASVMYLVYRHFDMSSNLLAKAALQRIPSIVKSNTLLSERVCNYNIGSSVDGSDISSTYDTIHNLIVNPLPAHNYRRYSADCSDPNALSRKIINHKLVITSD